MVDGERTSFTAFTFEEAKERIEGISKSIYIIVEDGDDDIFISSWSCLSSLLDDNGTYKTRIK